MKENNTLNLFADPDAIRIFWGYKQTDVIQEHFYKDLGETFMPGTPAILAPFGLNGYLPAVLNLSDSEKYPDEVALIVYPTRTLYDEARQINILGRIYTFSHNGAFDMVRSVGHWPGTTNAPLKHATLERWAWFTLGQALDWQKGQCRLFTVTSDTVDVFDSLLEFSKDVKNKLMNYGIAEMIVQSTRSFATIWLYISNQATGYNLEDIGFKKEGVKVLNDLYSEPFYFRKGSETLDIKAEKFIQFKFPREIKFYI